MKTNTSTRSSLLWILIPFGILNIITVVLVVSIWNREDKIAYVDAVKIFSKYKGMEDARSNFQLINEKYQSNLETLKGEVDGVIADYEQNKSKSSAKEIKLMEELIESKQKQFFDYEQVVKQQYQKQEREISTSLLNKVNDYIKRYGEKEGYKIILASTQYGNIAYGDKGVDITENILTGLNKEYKPSKKQ